MSFVRQPFRKNNSSSSSSFFVTKWQHCFDRQDNTLLITNLLSYFLGWYFLGYLLLAIQEYSILYFLPMISSSFSIQYEGRSKVNKVNNGNYQISKNSKWVYWDVIIFRYFFNYLIIIHKEIHFPIGAQS